MNPADLPAVNATLNALSAVFLTAGYIFVRRGHRAAHRNCMLAALGASALFLGSYLTYHFTVKAVTRFLEPAWFRPIYLTILLTHTVAAAAIVPLVLVTVIRALRQQFDRHKTVARWTWPLWMYVSVTGVMIYLLLYRIFPQH
jgi:putative membrane protein